MFRRISGSSSMTNIFFMVALKYGKPDRDSCSPANLTIQLDFPAMQFRAAFHEQQAEPGAGPRAHIAAAMKRLEQMLPVRLRNADALVADDTHRIRSVPVDRKMHHLVRLRIFHGVAQDINEDVAEQAFIRPGFRWH